MSLRACSRGSWLTRVPSALWFEGVAGRIELRGGPGRGIEAQEASFGFGLCFCLFLLLCSLSHYVGRSCPDADYGSTCLCLRSASPGLPLFCFGDRLPCSPDLPQIHYSVGPTNPSTSASQTLGLHTRAVMPGSRLLLCEGL